MATTQPTGIGARRVPDTKLRRARLATSAVFLLTGFMFASWAARLPALKAQLGVSDGQLAIAFIGVDAARWLGCSLGLW